MHYENIIRTFKTDNFKVEFVALEEYATLEELYPEDNEKQIQEMDEALRRYDAVLFCACVRVSTIDGLALGSSYLGGCHYKTEEQFFKSGEYVRDMVYEACKEARITHNARPIVKLKNPNNL